MTTMIITNEEMTKIIKIVQSFKNADLSIKTVSEIIEKEA